MVRFLKYAPHLLTVFLGFVGGLYFQAKVLDKKCPDFKCPDCVCPEQKPCQGIDFDKIKSKAVTIQNEQHITVNADSVFIERLRSELSKELERLKVRRCK